MCYFCVFKKRKKMIHKVYLDDEQVSVKEMPRCKLDVRPIGGVVPEGYITSEEFRKLAIAKVNKFCDKHGLL